MFKALMLKKNEENKKAIGKVEDINTSDLPEGDVLVKINYSTLNYKDSLTKLLTRFGKNSPKTWLKLIIILRL